MTAQELLYRIHALYGVEYDDLAEITRAPYESATGHRRQIYHYAEGARRAPFDLMRVISHHLIREYGCLDIAAAMLPEGFAIVPTNAQANGRVDDELLSITEAEGEVLKAMRRGDGNAVMAQADRIIREGFTLAAEGRAM